MLTADEYLSTLGLSAKQGKIYLDLASYPDSSVVKINSRIGEPRSSIYLELERMIDKGFVISKKVGKSTYYKITDPQNLRLGIEEERKRQAYLEDNLEEFQNTIQKLSKGKELPKTINIYRGKEGIKQMLWNIISSDATEVTGYSPGQLESVTDREFAEKWREEFMRRGKQNKIIFNQPKPKEWSDVPGFLDKYVDARTLDENKIKFDRLTLIYGDVFMVCSLKTDKDQYGIEIRDELLINSYKQIFNFLWDHVTRKMKG